MNSVILCEGRTDAILLSYYLGKVLGYRYSLEPEFMKSIKVEKNQEANWYKRGEDYLLIFGVGGKDNFVNVIDKYISPILMNYPKDKRFSNLVIIEDKDNREIFELENSHRKMLSHYINKVENGKWINSEFLDEFGNKNEIRTLSIIVPIEEQGAMETVLLQAISENEEDEQIVKQCGEFVENIKEIAKKYLPTNRMRLKAHLATVFAIISPEKVFSTLDSILCGIPWEKSEVLKRCFASLEEL